MFISGYLHQHVLLLSYFLFLDQFILSRSGFHRSRWVGFIEVTWTSQSSCSDFSTFPFEHDTYWAIVMFLAVFFGTMTNLCFWTHVSFQNCHLLKLRQACFVSVMFRFLGNWCKISRSLRLTCSSVRTNRLVSPDLFSLGFLTLELAMFTRNFNYMFKRENQVEFLSSVSIITGQHVRRASYDRM